MTSRRFLFLAAIPLFAAVSIGRAQGNSATTSGSQSESLGDVARKARAPKKQSDKPKKVFTNDDMAGLKGTVSVIGNHSAAPSRTDGTAEGTTDKKRANGDDKKKDEAPWRAKFAAARKTLADDAKELDILQREFNLKQEEFYQSPNAALKEQYSRDELNKTQSEIDAKKQAVEKDKQALSDLEDQLHRAGGDPGWASEPSQ